MKKSSSTLAKRYGKALYECLVEASKKAGTFEQYVEIVRTLSVAFDKKVATFFANPVLGNVEKNELLNAALQEISLSKLPLEITNFLQLVLEKNRFEALPAILKYVLAKADDHIGITRATVFSARALPEQSITDFAAALSTTLNKKIVLDTKISPDLYSGFILKVGNMKIDASLRFQLSNLKGYLNF